MAHRTSFSDGIGIVGIILTVVLQVLDKAGKLKGEWLVGLLLLAGAMTLFVAIGNPWVLDAPGKRKLWRGVLMFSLVALTYSGLIWTSGSSTDATEGRSPELAESTVAQRPSPFPSPAPTQPLPAKPKLAHRPGASHAIIQQSSTGDCSPNIIGSGNTNNCNQPPKVIASAQTQTMTGNSEAPWEVHFTISATGLVQTGDLRLKCSGPVIRAGISRINPAELITGSNGPDANDPRTVVYELGAETLSPKQTVTIVVYSKEPITVLSGTIGHEQIVF